jgi:transcriptional/translational regulatory protein YebC/TACO1|tara:strand:+ start:1294 stop:1608 length:315 start_codon:yes stop_codon:yes gene_type:complete
MENLINKNQAELQDHKLTAEEKLWRAVMATAIYDALHTPNVTKKGKYKVFTELTDIQEARNWFKTKEGSFETVCEALNMDADRVHKLMGSKIRQRQFQERLERL